ncbi:transmembrane protein 151 homolog isoform X1 [Paramacrobiotus metropolitanus]|uniref:transmembrane protein 151 homolog isoform X1 n=1 Tax=Paramacrobiotus metropolitanus TaxID=2943436 RepID=UPI00244627DD|nr:transmembrane protein 151 homolog isoform X1 [Paramacrobiotus metropolitanus]
MESQTLPTISFTVSESSLPGELYVTPPPLYEDVVELPPPSYDNVVNCRISFSSDEIVEEKVMKEWQDLGRPLRRIFCRCRTVWRALVLLCVIGGIVLLILSASVFSGTAPWGIVLGAVLGGVSYVIYICQALCYNPFAKFLYRLVFISDITQHTGTVRAGRPFIVWDMECYHYETRSSSRGLVQSSAADDTHKEKVTTWTGRKVMEFDSWSDISEAAPLAALSTVPRGRIAFHKQFILSDNDTEATFNRQRYAFIQDNRWRGKHYQLHESLEIPGFQREILYCSTPGRPFFLTWQWYIVAVVFLLELPFNFLTKMQYAHFTPIHYTYVKKLGL